MEGGDKEIQARISKPLTDGDLERHTGIKAGDIIKYSDLKNYKKIEDLLPKDKDAVVILIEDKYNSGHWVCLLRYGKTIEYFNSYGAKWDTDWKFVNKMMRVILGEGTNELTRLMDNAAKDGWNVEWNTKRFQKLSNRIQTCGRWCVFRIETMKMGYNNKQFHELVKKFKNETGGSSDFVVAKYVF
jgi:hypothetical protein